MTKRVIPLQLPDNNARDADGFIHKIKVHHRRREVAACDGWTRVGFNPHGIKEYCDRCFPEKFPPNGIYRVYPLTVDWLLRVGFRIDRSKPDGKAR